MPEVSATGNIDVSIEHKKSDPSGRDGSGGHPNTCPGCGSHYRDDELAEHLRVCPQCGHHFPVRARERVTQLADPRIHQCLDRVVNHRFVIDRQQVFVGDLGEGK